MKKILTEYFHKIHWERKGKIYKLKAEYIIDKLDTAAMIGTKDKKVRAIIFNITAEPKEKQVLDQTLKNITEAKKIIENMLEKDLSDERYHMHLWYDRTDKTSSEK